MVLVGVRLCRFLETIPEARKKWISGWVHTRGNSVQIKRWAFRLFHYLIE